MTMTAQETADSLAEMTGGFDLRRDAIAAALDAAYRRGWEAATQKEITAEFFPLSPGDGWLPIETAPRDGTAVLGFREIDPETHMNVVMWWADDGWQFTSRKRDALDGRVLPTHWRPLPSPPTEQKD